MLLVGRYTYGISIFNNQQTNSIKALKANTYNYNRVMKL